MKIEYKDDVDKGPGYGKLIFSEALLPAGPWRISIKRGSDQNYNTGGAGKIWTPEKILIPMQGAINENGHLTLFLNPALVDTLDPQEQYAIVLQGNGEAQKGRLHITGITFSPDFKKNNLSKPDADNAASPSPTQDAGANPRTPPAPQPANPPFPAPELEMPTSPTPHPKRWLRWLLILFLLLACAAWFYFDPRSKESSSTPDPARPAARQPTQTEMPLSAEKQVAEFFKNQRISPAGAMELAAKLPKKAAGDQDAVYRLYYFAAENAEPSAYFPYAQALDPTQPQWGSIEKDGAEAWKFYKLSSTQESSAALLNLEQWLEKQATANDARARQWLNLINRP